MTTIEKEIEWRSAEEGGPALIAEPVLCITKNKKLLTLKDTMRLYAGNATSGWEFLKGKYNIEWWTYQCDIMV